MLCRAERGVETVWLRLCWVVAYWLHIGRVGGLTSKTFTTLSPPGGVYTRYLLEATTEQ